MPDDFRSYLAKEIVSEQRTISYRNVARALKVHVNAAKCMLYEFYEHENGKRPGSIYATYLVAGTKSRETQKASTNGAVKHLCDDDEPMPPSSPPPFTSSMLEPSDHGSEQDQDESSGVPVKTIALVREELLEETKAKFDLITSIHLYSLSPTRIQDLATLTDIARGLFADTFVNEDPLIHNKTYGVIQNPEVRRRSGKRPIISEAPAPKFKPVKEDARITTSSKPAAQPAAKMEEPQRSGSSGSMSSAGPPSKPGTLKRDASDIFKSFAKAKSKPKPALTRNDTDASTNASASGAEDIKMTEAEEEGESEDDAMFLDTGTTKAGTRKRASDVKKERDDKAAKLRKMMDSDDEEEAATVPKVEDAAGINDKPSPTPLKKQKPTAGRDEEETDGVAWSDSDAEQPSQQSTSTTTKTAAAAAAEGSQPAASGTEPKRRRGRRKVMKKKTTKDEDGYLVTKEEAVWESFSEDEPQATQPAKKPADLKSLFPGKMQSGGGAQAKGKNAAATGAKGGASAKGGGGGNIMSFFGKK